MSPILHSFQHKPKICALLAILLLLFAFNSCIREEALNSEADILECTVPDPENKIGGNRYIKLSPGDTIVRIAVPITDQIGDFAPEFVLTAGATINPPSGTVRDFSQPQTYIVISQDKKWRKKYTVKFDSYALNQTLFSFEHFKSAVSPTNTKPYHIFYEIDEDTGIENYIWSSGNAGFAITQGSATPATDYPTFSTANGVSGRGVKLVTCSTGSFGAMVGMPIAAGNLFLGDFDASSAMAKPLEATRFGVPAKIGVPAVLRFWYKYTPGQEYKDVRGNTLSTVDKPDAYAIFYEPKIDNMGNPIKLHGENRLNVETENIILLARINEHEIIVSDDIDTAEYTQISIPFVPQQGRIIDPEKLKDGKYYIAIVFSSSFNGNHFEGAIGSTLYIDEVELICQEK